ncbi:MAG: amino acid-binding protein [Candidatus Altiarchaeales archaeon ex4484_2]|nr:MAG: amino acid-binding protein [Candidatus Altiarchaeales archaeon ex4484_2]
MLDLEVFFTRRKGQLRVAKFILRNGLRVSPDGGLYFKDIEVPHTSIARVLDVDRRLISATIDSILSDERLRGIYTKLDSMVLLRDVASELGFGAIEVIPTDAASRGIVADIAGIIADSGIIVRQLTTDDPMFKNAKMLVVTEKPLPRELIDRILELPEVEKVVVLN